MLHSRVMNSPKLRIITGLTVALLIASPAMADNFLTWSLGDVTFPNGGVVSGSFTVDTTTGTLSNIDVVSTADSDFGGATYRYASPTFGSAAALANANATIILDADSYPSDPNLAGTPTIDIVFDSSLGVAGTDALARVGEGSCANADCDTAVTYRTYYQASDGPAATSAPEPATGPLFALLGLASTVAAKFRRVRPWVLLQGHGVNAK